METLEFALLVVFAFGGWLMFLTGIYIDRRKRKGTWKSFAPIGSRIVDRLYKLARWMVAIARASDVALVEYRMVTAKPSDSFADEIELLNRSRSNAL